MSAVRKIFLVLSVTGIFILGGICAIEFPGIKASLTKAGQRLGLVPADVPVESLGIEPAEKDKAAVAQEAQEAKVEQKDEQKEEPKDPETERLAATLAPRIKVVGKRPEAGAVFYCGFNSDAFPQDYDGFEVSWFKEGDSPDHAEQLPQRDDGSFHPQAEHASYYVFCRVTAATAAGVPVEANSESVAIMPGDSQGS